MVRTPTKPAASVVNATDCSTVWYAAAVALPVRVSTPST
ncbi:hypothetical protein MYFR107205_31090 [Mycolicibacterium frederiksbergense]